MYHIRKSNVDDERVMHELLEECAEIDRRLTAEGKDFLADPTFQKKEQRAFAIASKLGIEVK